MKSLFEKIFMCCNFLYIVKVWKKNILNEKFYVLIVRLRCCID